MWKQACTEHRPRRREPCGGSTRSYRIKCLSYSDFLHGKNINTNMLMKGQWGVRRVCGEDPWKEGFKQSHCFSIHRIVSAGHPLCDRRAIRPNCLRLPLFHPLHFYSTEIYFTYTNYCLCTFLLIIDVTAFVFLPISYLLIQSTHRPFCHHGELFNARRKKKNVAFFGYNKLSLRNCS